ncbi:MAG: ABC transporter permease [Erysipelotrichaceae bacterium]|nr:ABC transporter permease [Erysipelotrichaceae bacterium]
MRTINFAKRCFKEIIRDPLNIIFGLGFPIVLLLLLSAIQKNIPVDLFEIESLAPGIVVFGLSFFTLFSATLIAKDRESSFLKRLYTMPMKSYNFILGYMLPLIPLAIIQSSITYLVAMFLGLPFSLNVIFAILLNIPMAIFYIALGLLCGSVFNVKQVGGICGALLTNLSAWLSGIWFDLELVGGTFNKIASFLPFVHAVELERVIISSCYNMIYIYPILIYGLITTILSIVIFVKKK